MTAGFLLDSLKWTCAAGLIALAHLAAIRLSEAGEGGAVSLTEPVFVELVLPEAELQPVPMAASGGERETTPDDPASAEAAPDQATPEPAIPFAPLPPLDAAELLPEPDPATPEVPDSVLPPMQTLPPLTDFAELIDPQPRLIRSQPPAARPRQPDPALQRQAAPKPAPTPDAATRQPNAPAAQGAPSQPARTTPSAGARQSWQRQAGAMIARHMQRTRLGAGRGSVTVQLAITVGAGGTIQAQLANSTGDARHDSAISRQAARLPRVPPPPGGQPVRMVLPIRIDM
ncbi:hypothetical protein [Paracoccus jeotgali]|uniref:hypothetical protein n=1 Tax=Paracoccus jeotgali TaxID=2065379 RepID=UPI0028A7F7EF|nr:hypothetical protein [Paracoccus jeotgali]